MHTQHRIAEYHRRRQRLARRRSGDPGRAHRLSPSASATLPGSRMRADRDGELSDALRELTRRACAYRAVKGLLLRCTSDLVQIQLIADHPMTGPLRLLSAAWCAELSEAHPGLAWSLEVAAQPPVPEQHFQCLYWCQH